MASTNQSPQYHKAESMFLRAQTNEEKLKWLEEMIRECPKHKSSEKMLANLKTRYIKLKEKIESVKKTKKGSKKKGIKKEDMQAVIIGFANSGKSSLLSLLTNMRPEISEYPFTTKMPLIGAMKYSGTGIQIVEIPAVNSEHYDRGTVNTADVVLELIDDLGQLKEIEEIASSSSGKKVVVYNIKDKGTDERKLEATLKSKKLDYVMINTGTGEGIEELKEKIFKSFGKIRVFTKEPGKQRSEKPFIFWPDASVKDVAEKIFGTSGKVIETKIWGPSSKFPGQKVGITHVLKDMDTVEFKTR